MFRQLTTFSTDTTNLSLALGLLIAGSLAVHWLPDGLFKLALNGFVRLPAPAQACVLFVLALGLYSVASSDLVPFIYSRF